MPASQLTVNPRVGGTPYMPQVEAAGVQAYTVCNHTLLATAFRSLEDDYRHLKQHVQLWDVSCERRGNWTQSPGMPAAENRRRENRTRFAS